MAVPLCVASVCDTTESRLHLRKKVPDVLSTGQGCKVVRLHHFLNHGDSIALRVVRGGEECTTYVRLTVTINGVLQRLETAHSFCV
jgi:hypothetical protein